MIGVLRRIRAGLVLAVIFVRELGLSAMAVARAAFAREVRVSPAIIAVPVDLRTDWGVAMVANLITLTPGTTSLHVSADRTLIYVHCLDAPAVAAATEGIKTAFESRVREVEG